MIQQVGKYVLERELGHGAMGSVWQSSHPGLGIQVAVKILDHKLSAEDPEYLSRFIKEGTLAASINHQNVVRVLDAGHQGSTYFLVMELIEGLDAKELVEQRGVIPGKEVLELAICTASALKEAHKKGIVHRDIKPDNIMVTNEGDIKLADLGIAKQLGDDYGTTMAGTTIGTPFYIAPEQAMDSSTVDERCDIYSLGATMYHLLTGSVPFPGSSAMSILMKHVQEPLEHPKDRRPDLKLSSKLCSVICKMMEKDPDNRYQNCDELLEAFDAVKHKKSSSNSKKIHFSASSKKSSSDTNDKAKQNSRNSAAAKSSKNVKKKNKLLPVIAGLTAFAVTLVIALILFSPGNDKKTESPEVSKKETNTQKKTAPEDKFESSFNDEIDPNVLNAFGAGFDDSPAQEVKQTTKSNRNPSAISKPVLVDQLNSRKVQLGSDFSIFCEFRANVGILFSKSTLKEWVNNSKILYIDKGKLIYATHGAGMLESDKTYNDGKYHRALIRSSNGVIEMHVDGELVGSKQFTAPDRGDFRLKIAADGEGKEYKLDGHLLQIAFWNNALPNIRMKDLFRGSGAPESAVFYYSEDTYDPLAEVNKNFLTKALDQLENDNPGLKIDREKRVKIINGDINLNLAGYTINNANALRGLKLKTLNLWMSSIKDSSFLKDIKLESLLAMMLKNGSISVSHLNPDYLKEFRATKSKVTELHLLRKFNLRAISIDFQKGLISHIKHMPLETLEITDCQPITFSEFNKEKLRLVRLFAAKGFKNISSLNGFKLKEFHISDSDLEDISALKEMPLEKVTLCNTKVKDLSPLANKNITSLIVPGSSNRLHVVRSLKSLEKIAIPKKLWTKDIEFLKNRNLIIEGFEESKRSLWLAWGVISKRDSDQFWIDFQKHISQAK